MRITSKTSGHPRDCLGDCKWLGVGISESTRDGKMVYREGRKQGKMVEPLNRFESSNRPIKEESKEMHVAIARFCKWYQRRT